MTHEDITVYKRSLRRLLVTEPWQSYLCFAICIIVFPMGFLSGIVLGIIAIGFLLTVPILGIVLGIVLGTVSWLSCSLFYIAIKDTVIDNYKWILQEYSRNERDYIHKQRSARETLRDTKKIF